jgi:hypothetical protein
MSNIKQPNQPKPKEYKDLKGDATVMQVGYITMLLEKYIGVKTVSQMRIVEEVAGIKFMYMTKQEASDLISKLKNDIPFTERLTNMVLGVD